MAENVVPVGATNIGTVDKDSVLFQKLVDFDPDLGLAQGSTYYRERLTAPSYAVLTDSIADGLSSIWTQTNANGGSFTLSAGEGLLQTTTAAAGSTQVISTVPVYQPGQVNWLRCAGRFGDTGVAGNVRRLGAFTVGGTGGIVPQDGFAFELDGTTLYAAAYKAGAVTRTIVTSWTNATVAPLTFDGNYHLYELRWGANFCAFYVDNVFRHLATSPTTAITTTLNFPMAAQNIKTSGATNVVMAIRNIGIGRFGEPPAVGQLTDVAKVTRHFFMDNFVAAPVAEALMSVTQTYGTTAVAATTTPAVVPPGKVLRLVGGRLSTKSLAAAGSAVMRVRANFAGLATATSTLIGTFEVGSRAAVAGLLDHTPITFPPGVDIPAGAGVGFTLAGYNATGALTLQGVTRFEVWGYEYNAF